MKFFSFVVIVALFLTACGNDNGSSVGDGRSNDSTLGSSFETYYETGSNTLELTNYTLDTDGLKIYDEFTDAMDPGDVFLFNTGIYGRVNVTVFIDGVRQYEENAEVIISLDNFVNDGYSTLNANGYFINASVSPTGEQFQNYRLGIVSGIIGPDLTGSSYVIEISASI